ncbi:LysR substrate-binding domain-containing protein [Pseudomonas fulva]|uniref:LysR substrate-binding domain-containing protein n=1 Tax=Pseudomonas fulva TaxID=47880 RepID=UPI0038515649
MPAVFSELPSLGALRVFEVVARHLNFGLAAEELGVTQPAVAQQIRGLERALEVRLFERLPRGLALTDAGRGYSETVRTAMAMLDEATRRLRPAPSHITVSVTPTFAAKRLIPRLGGLAERYPTLDVRVLATDRLSHFHTDGVDLAVRYGRPPFGPGLEQALLMGSEIIAVASPTLVAALGPPEDFATLERYVALCDAHDLWPSYRAQVYPGHPAVGARSVQFNQTSLAIDAAIGGQGIALAERAFVAQEIDAGRLVQVAESHLRPDKAFYLVWPRKARDAQQLQWVIDWLRSDAGDRKTTG